MNMHYEQSIMTNDKFRKEIIFQTASHNANHNVFILGKNTNMQNAEYVNQLTQDCRSVVAVIVDTHWTPPIISVLSFAKWFSSKNVYSKHARVRNLEICTKMPQGKKLDKTKQTKN